MNEVDRIVGLLTDDSIEKRIAAAIVLGELRVKRAQDALVALVGSEVPVLQRHALEALTRIGLPKKLLPKLFASLTSPVGDVRDAARAAIASYGEEIVPAIRERIAHAQHDEKKALDAILAALGGKDAFTALLDGLTSTDGDEAKQAALAMRAQVKNAGARERRSYLAETEKFLTKHAEAGAPPAVIAAAIKIMGYLEDENATDTLLAYAGDAKQPAAVRQEALIALRFALAAGKADEKKVVAALLDAAEADDRTLAHTALHTLGPLEVAGALARRVEKLATHPDYERARFALEMLGRQSDEGAVKALVHAATTLEKKRAEVACAALAGKEDAVGALARALLESKDVDRAWMLKSVLRPMAKKIAPALRKQILETAIDRLTDGERGWEALLDIARDGDADGVATSLRGLALKLRKAKNDDKSAAVYSLLCRGDRATDDDRYALASLELARGTKDTRVAIRASDESLKMLSTLATRGFDVASALRKDRSLELDALYYVGFHFAEAKSPLGEELLEEVVKKGGRTKVGKMARNKLSLLQGNGAVEEADAD